MLGANLVTLGFTHPVSGCSTVKRVPKAITISALKGIAGRLFGEKPFKLRLELEGVSSSKGDVGVL